MSLQISYRRQGGRWEAVSSDGDRITADHADLSSVRLAAHALLAARLGCAAHEVAARIGAEFVQVPEVDSVAWQSLSFCLRAPDFGVDDPTPEQVEMIVACFEYYRDAVPEGMRVECYANRVRIEPGAFGLRAAIRDNIAGQLAATLPDDARLVVGPSATGADHGREQLRRALLLDVPDGFVRVVTEVTGFEDYGDVGVIHLVLRDRWRLDSPL